jgi:hypothetical protein
MGPSNPNTNPNVNPSLQPGAEQPGQGVEAAPQPAAPEVAPAAPQGAPQAAPAQQPAQIPNVPPQAGVPAQGAPTPDPAPATATGGVPAGAADVDVIEKEWVDQANKVIDQTKDDPYTEEEAVEALQQDYLKKRYGHDVKKPGQG